MRNLSRSIPLKFLAHPLGPTWLVIIAACVYAALMSALSLVQDQGLKTQMNDLGNMDQALWSLVNGDLLMTQSNSVDENLRSRLGVHGNLIFYPLSLLYLAIADRRALLLVGSLACAAAGLGLYAYARKHWGRNWWSILPSLMFWLSPVTQDANLYDFHVTTLATAFLVWLIWAFEAGRLKTAWLLFALFLSCKEDMPFIGLLLGLYFALSGQKRLGLQVAAVSLIYLVLLFAVVIPLANHGETLIQLTHGAASRVAWQLSWADRLLQLLQPDRLRLPLYLLIGGAVFLLKEWRFLLLLLVPLAEGMGANTAWMTRLTGVYYWITAEAIIVLALIRAASATRPDRLETWRIHAVGGATLLLSLLFSPLPYSFAASQDDYRVMPEAKVLDDEIAKLIPAEAALSVQNNLGPRFSQRRDVASFPRRLETAQFVLLHLRYPGAGNRGFFVRNSPETLFEIPTLELAKSAWTLASSGDWGLIAAKQGYYLFAKDQPSRFSLSETKDLIKDDYRQFEAAVSAADQQFVPWSLLLTGQFGWRSLFDFVRR